MTTPEATIEFVAFCLQAAPGVGASTLRSILARIARDELSPDNLLRFTDNFLLSRLGINPSIIDAIRNPGYETLDTWRRLDEQSVRILVRGQPGYPQRLFDLLGDTSPPILFVLGETDPFRHRGVGFCGSRKASARGLRVAKDCASLLAQQKVNVISGYAHGIDVAAHRAALEAGGTTTVVMAEGILQFKIKAELRDLVSKGDFSRLSVVSEFPPGLPWRAYNAMTRNRTICGLSHAMVVIESGSEGGTFEAGKAALELGEPLFCVEYSEAPPEAAGNPYFLKHGAQSLRRSRNGEPNLTRLLSVVRNTRGELGHHQHDLLLSKRHY
jgi:DNA protecting protein DprA